MDVQALKAKILSCGYNIVEFSDKVGIDRSTFYRRLDKDGNNFTIEEALRIKEVLSLTDSEAYSIFLSN
jgi:predicted DNA-binding transcriptional regulator AlpA